MIVPLAIAIGASVLALLVVQIVHLILVRLGRRSEFLAELARRAHRPTQAVAALTAVSIAVRSATVHAPWRGPFLHGVTLLIIAAAAWLIAALMVVAEDTALSRYRLDVTDNRHARRIHTQVVMLRRVTIAIVAILAVAVMLMTFPAARTIGASLLASAGIAGVVAALAAQSMLGNVFAGLQIAFSDSLRIDDVVIVENEWGRVEEITLSYVVVHVWDDRRIILPTSYFTTKPFQNWTRNEAKLLGTVEVDCDWTMPVEALREELRRFLETSAADLWDGRVSVLQVTDATGGAIRLRALVSAKDAPTLWDLRCLVREHLVGWVRDRHGDALPKTRAEVGARLDLPLDVPAITPTRPAGPDGGDDRVFSGSTDGEERAGAFHGPEDEKATIG